MSLPQAGCAGDCRRGERGAALVIAILVLAILTVIGIALMLITSTESRIAANEWSVNRAFYASDAGIRWATVQMHDPVPFMARPEFGRGSILSARVLFQLPSHRYRRASGSLRRRQRRGDRHSSAGHASEQGGTARGAGLGNAGGEEQAR